MIYSGSSFQKEKKEVQIYIRQFLGRRFTFHQLAHGFAHSSLHYNADLNLFPRVQACSFVVENVPEI